jgi:hypothetical protein
MSAREHDPDRTVLDVEAAYRKKIGRLERLTEHEQQIRRAERDRHARRLYVLCSPSVVADPTGFAPGCVIDHAPQPDGRRAA